MLFDLDGKQFKVSFYRIGTTTFAKLCQFASEINSWFEVNTCAALCNPKDRFEKKIGRKIALSRILHETEELHLSKEDRAAIWEIYFKEHKK